MDSTEIINENENAQKLPQHVCACV